MEDFYSQFTREKQHLQNVSPATVEGYQWAWMAFEPVLAGGASLTKADIASSVAELSKRGLSPVAINTYLRSLNTFFRWMHEHTKLEMIRRYVNPQTEDVQAVHHQYSVLVTVGR